MSLVTISDAITTGLTAGGVPSGGLTAGGVPASRCPAPLTAAIRRAIRQRGDWSQTAQRVAAALRDQLHSDQAAQ